MLAATAPAPAPLSLTGAIVRQASEDVMARLTFSAPVPAADANAGRRACVTLSADLMCLHGRVIPEAHISTGISHGFGLDWVRHAAAQARTDRPDVTVVWIGPNEGFPIAGVRCCRAAWIKRYADRVRAMMRFYRRGGRALVYWLTLPIPPSGELSRVLRA